MRGMNKPAVAAKNPLLTDWTGPFGLPPFGAIAPAHFRPAFDAALSPHRAEIDAIAANPAPPDFDNTIVALEQSGRALERVANVFFVLAGADTSDAIEAVERDGLAAARPPRQRALSQPCALCPHRRPLAPARCARA